MNEYDSNRILDLTKKIKYEPTQNLKDADCYILNTCHIREKATDKVYHDIGRLKKEFRNKPKPIVLIAGCVAQAEDGIRDFCLSRGLGDVYKRQGEIVEFVDKDIEKLQNEVAKKLGYKLVDHKLELYGSKIKK